jgi:hypothetical protein
MNPTGKDPSSILEELRTRLATNVQRDPETLLAAMPEDKRNAILVMAREANRVMRFSNISAAQAITRLFPNAGSDNRKIVLALLNAEEERPDYSAQDAAREQAWAEWDKLRPIEEVLAEGRASRERLNTQTQAALSEPKQLSFLDQLTPPEQPHSGYTGQSGFMRSLTASESGGRADAEYVTQDGRRHVGLLQFSDARLEDYRNATGETFSQDAFVQDMELQQRVGDWHVADIDKAIDDLGSEAAGYDRDGLRAIAHLGGQGAMRRFVRSNGSYNPSDELGTSLSDYYARFSSGAS